MLNKTQKLSLLPGEYAVCCLPPQSPLPDGLKELVFWCAMRTPDELSLVVPAAFVQPNWQVQPGWSVIKVHGPLDFSLTGILAGLARTLAEADISIFALSTYQTDYILVPETQSGTARQALETAGCIFE